MAPLAGLVFALGCQGPDEFFRYSADAGQTGTAGSSGAGTAGASGVAGTTGSGGGPIGAGGSGGSTGTGAGTAGSIGTGTGGSGTGTGGTANPTGTGGGAGASSRGGAAGTSAGTGNTVGSAGTTGAGGGRGGSTGTGNTTGTAGSAGTGTGRGGTPGTAGVTGTAGSGTGTGGSATGTGGTGAPADGGATTARVEIQAKCQGNNDNQNIRVTFRILNPDSVTKQLSDIKLRYYFTPTVPLTPMVTFDYAAKIPTGMLTSTATASYVEVGFAAGTGTLAAFDNVTGTDQIQLRIYNFGSTTWNTDFDDDYSEKACATGANVEAYVDRTTMPAYYQGQIAWGSEPPIP